MSRDLTKGPIIRTMLLFAMPMLAGNLLQQLYNIVDSVIVGRYLGADALAAVGSAYSLMVFLTSIILGLCMGSGNVFSIHFGAGDKTSLCRSIFISFFLILAVAAVIEAVVLLLADPILVWLAVPETVVPLMKEYISVIFWGILFTFFYNYFACLLRAVGNSVAPLSFLVISAILNIILDLVFVMVIHLGVAGAAAATVISQGVSALLITIYTLVKYPQLFPKKEERHFTKTGIKDIFSNSSLTCLQQSVMNFGILMIQGLVNSFGAATMTAFSAGVKIDSFAYMPVQDFGNALSTFLSQNFGAGKTDRIRKSIKASFITSGSIGLAISLLVFIFARPLLTIFIDPGETEILSIGVSYLRLEGAFYIGIAFLFLLYGMYRAIRMAGMSLILTIVSLGTRVLLAYTLAPAMGTNMIWLAIPIGWFLADALGIWYYLTHRHIVATGEKSGK